MRDEAAVRERIADPEAAYDAHDPPASPAEDESEVTIPRAIEGLVWVLGERTADGGRLVHRVAPRGRRWRGPASAATGVEERVRAVRAPTSAVGGRWAAASRVDGAGTRGFVAGATCVLGRRLVERLSLARYPSCSDSARDRTARYAVTNASRTTDSPCVLHRRSNSKKPLRPPGRSMSGTDPRKPLRPVLHLIRTPTVVRLVSESIAESKPRSVDVVGPPDAAPLVLVHGTVFNRTMWAPQREALSDAFRVIVPDLPGHGERRNESFDLDEAVETVDEVVDRHARGRARLVGLSLGGYVATEFARRHPQKVETLILSGSSANPVGLLGLLSRIAGGIALLASKSRLIGREVDRIAARWVRNRQLPHELEAEIVDAGFDLRPFGEAGFEIAGVDFRAAFASFGGPALVLNGQLDLLMRLGERSHVDAAEDARLSVIDGAGHVCNLERVDEYEAAVRDFNTAD